MVASEAGLLLFHPDRDSRLNRFPGAFQSHYNSFCDGQFCVHIMWPDFKLVWTAVKLLRSWKLLDSCFPIRKTTIPHENLWQGSELCSFKPTWVRLIPRQHLHQLEVTVAGMLSHHVNLRGFALRWQCSLSVAVLHSLRLKLLAGRSLLS